MYSPIPVYSIGKESRHRAAREGAFPTFETGRSAATSSPTMPLHQLHYSIGDLLEPAIEGPPSPEHIRAFSNQIKRNSSSDKHRSELTTSSSSSSRLSGTSTSDRPSWNPSLESLNLSRNPSQRSTSSGVPSRDRPDSVQFFGKAIFNRRGKMRRESSDQSSHSSLDASEVPIDTVSTAFKDQPFIQSVFARRRALRGEPASSSQKKLQISGPYNFQHVTHTHKDSVPDLDRSNRIELVSEFSNIRPRRTTDASLNSVSGQHDESQFASFSSETFSHQEDPSAGLNALSNGAHSRQKDLPQPPPPPVAPMRLARRTLSQDKIRVPPPRPPRSPTDNGFKSPIPPPPRTSSRVSLRRDGVDSLLMSSIERPATSTGFRKPQPFSPTSPKALRSASHSRVSSVAESIQEVTVESGKFAHAVTTPDEAAWPLANNVKQLPDVPEEDEHHSLHRASRMSVASNHSSLRGSISVPLLRQLSLKQSHQRPPSNASDTLGRFDFSNNQRVPRAGCRDDDLADDASPLNWEDDIDYCYEHEAEANCDYAWERPSIDMIREDDEAHTLGDPTETIVTFGGFSPSMLSPVSADIPALSPASQTSNMTQHEAVTPTNLAIPVTSNFSRPRRDSSAQLLREGSRTHSSEFNFKESQGFSLSPSLLIPNDYHQEMLQYEREELQDSEDDEDFLIQGATLNDELIMKVGKSIAPSNIRSSASTTDSVYSEQSMTSSRHKSITSNSTAFTRWTGSSASSWQTTRDSAQHILPKPSIDDMRTTGITSPTKVITLPKPDDEASLRQDLNREKHARTKSHADLLMRNTCDAAPTVEARLAKEPLRTRRRARTTSRSHASPQFALFPSISPATHGNRI
ncbi:hypothetical protein F4818DRAFT_321191 [Hypoxylon cercidicola]|nr:hypothetical protein F4818DRAFT_321191 [Hypoxylon cercidicola]